MLKIVYIQADGSSHTVESNPGESVMNAAVRAGIDGIVGECGGNAMCATCHVYVDEASADAFPPRSDDEDFLLDDAASERTDASRLGCQLIARADTDEVTVYVPETQY
ncbi:2Fe-2S iron-sulfur cluster-binding protein [Nocardia sp. NPDC055049]